MEKKAIRNAYGEALKRLGEINKNVVVLDGDLSGSTMTKIFKSAFPERFFNMGIAEQNIMGAAAGLAIDGKIPFASTFAMFGAGRAFEIIRNSICYPKLNVKVAVTHAGISVGEDGASHQAVEDVSIMRSIPNMTVIVPCDALEAEKAVFAAAEFDGPCYLRMARPATNIITNENTPFKIGKANILKEGKDICIFASGIVVPEALEAAQMAEKDGISVTVVNVHTIKPIDREVVVDMAKKHSKLISVEEHSIIGGLGSAISEVLTDEYPCKLIRLGIKDTFGESGTVDELMNKYGLNAKAIYEALK
ncbi:transketolase family protein [Brachyspira murdochii]|uniref:Transketolase n=1 Tax=Brachyspira murdochii TaxID=84378 RepID=A0ABX5B192_9SPIR|nr:transketolase family protein [Brachyspira murdochii]PPS20965.1 transketolase [Brachyspira murdochii]